MLQAELLHALTSNVLRLWPRGSPARIRVSPLQKPASKNEITFAVHRLHCCGISGWHWIIRRLAGVRESMAFCRLILHDVSDNFVRYQRDDCVVAFPSQHNRSGEVMLEFNLLWACNWRVLIQEVVNYSDPTQSVSLLCNLHKLQLTFATQKPPLVDPADLNFYTLATLKQHVKQFEGFTSKQTHSLLV